MSISKAYNSWSKTYDTNHNKTRDLDKLATQKVLTNYKFDLVMEMGCGTGKNTEWLLTQAKCIYGFDFSEKMLEIAKNKIQSEKVIFQKADLNEPWEVENNFADLVTFNLVLEHIKDLEFVFQQSISKLKSNGKLFLCELHPFRQYQGSQAKFETENGVMKLEVYTHHLSEYIETAEKVGFKMLEIKEWFDLDKKELPRLISLVFEK